MPKKNIPPTPLAVALKKRAMALNADIPRQLHAADHLSPRLLHGTRVVMKRLRAWWQLMLPLAGRTAVRRAQDRLTAVAQMLAPARDVHVMHQMLRRLSPRVKTGPVRVALEAVDRQLATAAAEGAAPEFPPLRDQLLRVFKSDAAAWRRLPVALTPDDLIVAEMARTYRRARRRGRRAARRDTARDLHAWRMWVKAHLHQMEFFNTERRGRWAEMVQQLARLGRLLGRGQDLAILDGWVDWRESTGALNRKTAGRVHTLLHRRQDELRTRCERLGRRLFAAKPKVFAARLRGWSGSAVGSPHRKSSAALRGKV
jgi:CHAD domain-containing protein